MKLTPIVLFVYKRLDTLKACIEALKTNPLHAESKLFIFSDAPASSKEEANVGAVRKYIEGIDGFEELTIFKAEINKGLADSVISGVSQIVDLYGKVIVLEDDLVVSNNFLAYMNKALIYYQNNKEIFSISGFTTPIKVSKKYHSDVYFTQRASSWGWATWKDRWIDIDWEIQDFDKFTSDANSKKAFNRMGSDMATMLEKQMKGQINSWAIRWCFYQFQKDLFTVFPLKSKVKNIGFNNQGTHTKQWYNRFATSIDYNDNTDFKFSDNITMDTSVLKQFLSKHTIKARIISKFLNMLPLHKR